MKNIVLMALAGISLAFTVKTTPETDQVVYWPEMPLESTFIDDHRLPAGSANALARAFAAWSDVDGSEAGFDAQPALDAVPVVALDDQQVVFMPDTWDYGPDALAIASVWSNDQTGELLHFDVRINPTIEWSLDGEADHFDLETAMIHELGHILGLEHSEVGEAVMYADLAAGSTRRELHADDEDGLRFLYPDGIDDDRASVGCTSLGTDSLAWGLVLLPPLVARVRRRAS